MQSFENYPAGTTVLIPARMMHFEKRADNRWHSTSSDDICSDAFLDNAPYDVYLLWTGISPKTLDEKLPPAVYEDRDGHIWEKRRGGQWFVDGVLWHPFPDELAIIDDFRLAKKMEKNDAEA